MMPSTYYSRCNSPVAESHVSGALSDATWMTSGGTHPMGKGQVLFTGPSGIRDYKVNVVTDDRMVGIGTMSPEGTSALQYIWRGAPGVAPPRRRSQWVGEIGWFIPPFHDYRNTMSGNQIQLKEFRKAQEEKYTHRFQEPWYPSPKHPDYKQMFPFTQGSKSGWRKQTTNSERGSETPLPRPHTVASYHSNDQLPTLVNNSNNADIARPVSAQASLDSFSNSRPTSGQYGRPSSHIEHHSRPPSGQSMQPSQSSQFRPTSVTSVHTPPGSRPGNGVGYETRSSPVTRSQSMRSMQSRDNDAQSVHSRGSQTSLLSRTSQRSHTTTSTTGSRRQRITPAATSVSSAYRAPMSDPEY